jgi:hypothetical protein
MRNDRPPGRAIVNESAAVTISKVGPDVERAVEQALAEHGFEVESVEATKSDSLFWGLSWRSMKMHKPGT